MWKVLEGNFLFNIDVERFEGGFFNFLFWFILVIVVKIYLE